MTLQELKHADNIFLIDIVVSCDSNRKSYARPITMLSWGAETHKPIYGTADEINDILCHFQTLDYHIKKNHCETSQGDTCYSIFNRRIKTI